MQQVQVHIRQVRTRQEGSKSPSRSAAYSYGTRTCMETDGLTLEPTVIAQLPEVAAVTVTLSVSPLVVPFDNVTQLPDVNV